MVSTKIFIITLVPSVAIALAAIIYIIVDNTTYCRYGRQKPNTAVSLVDGTVVCLPGYTFPDGNTYHNLTCDKPPNWNWGDVPECLPISEAIGWQCPVSTADSSMAGEFIIVQPSPSSKVYVEGRVIGLNSSDVKSIDVLNSTKSCFLTFESGSSTAGHGGTQINGTEFLVSETFNQPLLLNETFQLSVRAIGSRHARNLKNEHFCGVAVFFLEQNERTIGVYSANTQLDVK